MAYRRDSALRAWRQAKGLEELVRCQTKYNEAQETIDQIDKPLR